MLISIVIPCYRSAKTLPSVVAEIDQVFAQHPEHDYQLILANDSPFHEETCQVIRQLCTQNDKLTAVFMSRNFGQARARMAALPYAKGECVVCMDDDGQHPAEGIFDLVAKMQEGYDVVYARFQSKQHSAFKRITSNLYRSVAEGFGVRPKGISTSSFLVWSRFAVDQLIKYQSPTPSAGSYLLKVTSNFANVDMPHRARIAGKSGYSLSKLLNLTFTGLTNFTTVPLRISAVLGFIAAAIGFIAGLVIIVQKFVNPSVVMGYTSTVSVLLLLGGLILLALGLIGEYIGRIYMLLSNMPQYVVRETIFGVSEKQAHVEETEGHEVNV